jgi:hypothetical protein
MYGSTKGNSVVAYELKHQITGPGGCGRDFRLGLARQHEE